MYAYYESHFDPYYPLPSLIHSYLSSFPKSYYLFHIKFHIAKPLLRVVKNVGMICYWKSTEVLLNLIVQTKSYLSLKLYSEWEGSWVT